MSAVEVSYQEATETARIEAVPFSHLSVETGHLVLAQFADGDQALIEQLEQAGPWLEASVKRARKRFGRDARISTCFLVDDQTPWDQAQERPKPSEVFDLVASAGARVGFAVDYIACESGCATARDRPYAGPHDRSPLADIVAGAIVAEPEAGANGSRPPTGQSGWLSNGRRSPSVSVAMDAPQWEPPAEFGPYRHSVFVDVELWSTEHGSGPDAGRERQYSSSLLTAVWQLLRLGLVRNAGRAVATPTDSDRARPCRTCGRSSRASPGGLRTPHRSRRIWPFPCCRRGTGPRSTPPRSSSTTCGSTRRSWSRPPTGRAARRSQCACRRTRRAGSATCSSTTSILSAPPTTPTTPMPPATSERGGAPPTTGPGGHRPPSWPSEKYVPACSRTRRR
ncbi:SCO2522 family protein [Catenulispora yoronensis]